MDSRTRADDCAIANIYSSPNGNCNPNPDSNAAADSNSYSSTYRHGNSDPCSHANADTNTYSHSIRAPFAGRAEGPAGQDCETCEADLLDYP